MNRTDRLYALVEELRAVAPAPRSARRLAERYEVSTRTIERDILALQESGVPVYAETGRHGGYVIDKTVTLPPLNFTATEMAAIAVMVTVAEGTPFAAAARSALRKMVAGVPRARADAAAGLVERIRMIRGEPGASGGGAEGQVPLAIQDAIAIRHVLMLEYRDRLEAITIREVEPIAFTGTRAHWYLLAWCRLREAPRAFRVDRIVAVKDTGELAPRRELGDVETDIPERYLRRLELVG